MLFLLVSGWIRYRPAMHGTRLDMTKEIGRKGVRDRDEIDPPGTEGHTRVITHQHVHNQYVTIPNMLS